jgi:pyruvate/2-oxoglutarate dehydrogenase complex dihydrolipoamide dehydrogenase (E3) component
VAFDSADPDNRALIDHVHPPTWVNPTPASRYNLVVIGGGTAGLVAAAGAAGLGARVALIERQFMGGDCLVTGCVPSKTLIRAARAAADVMTAHRHGVNANIDDVDFAAVMARIRAMRATIAPHDSAARFQSLGVDVFFGHGRFCGHDTVDVDGARLRFARAVIATGGRPNVPTIPGLSQAGPLTSESVFELTTQPRRLAVIGGGAIGCELAQAFARLGSTVTLLEAMPQLLANEDPDTSRVVHDALAADGVAIHVDARVDGVRRDGHDRVLSGDAGEIRVDEMIVATGRTPNVDDLGLDAAGIDVDPKRGIRVNDLLRTTNRRVFAAGDVCLEYQFTHAADASARLAIQNALFLGRKHTSALRIPWAIFTSPEVARIGLSATSAAARGVAVDTFERHLTDVDRARIDADTEGFVKVLVAAGTDRIVGATIVAPHAGDLISEIAVAMEGGVGLGRLARVIHPYPTLADAIRQLGDAYNRTRLTPTVTRVFDRWLRWNR